MPSWTWAVSRTTSAFWLSAVMAIAATTTYGGAELVAAVGQGNLFATQFHPEKSQHAGIGVLRNFVRTVDSGAAS